MEKNALFSIIIVSLNAGEGLRHTLKSISAAEFKDYEVILKDGGSLDNSLACVKEFAALPLKLVVKEDKGIYDAMNEAVRYARGEYIYFLNCGDIFASTFVLNKVADVIKSNNADIYYGNIFDVPTKRTVMSNPKLNAFGCYRNVPCHQACFYKRELLKKHPFEIKYKVRADYEHFLWCFFKEKAKLCYMDLTIADYEGKGFSDKNIKISDKEHKEITKKYMSKGQLILYKAIMLISLAPLRTYLSKNPATAGVYNAVKKLIYKGKSV